MSVFNDREDQPVLFRFAIVTDSHLSAERPGHSSPWMTNRLANGRSRYVVQLLNRLAPEFVVHLGDLVHPVPILPSYADAAERFREIYGQLKCPLHLVAGNHDLGDKPGAYMPAAVIDDRTLRRYEETFGSTYYSFEHGGCRFLVLNTPVLNTGMPLELEQREWLERTLREGSTKRTFLCLHYPLYLTEPHEIGHYENLDEPARSWLLDLIQGYGIEAAFSGHTHTFFYNRYVESELYVLPSVTSVRQDYSELFRIPPAEGQEFGRNDTGKFGVLLVTVRAEGHEVDWIPTDGATLDDEVPATSDARLDRSRMFAGKKRQAGLAVDLRHPWAEVVELPHNYLTDAFVRKRVRNDYPLLALWQLGADQVRVPLGDLLDQRVRQRMAALVQRGRRFTVMTLGTPTEQQRQLLAQHGELVERLEVVLPWHEVDRHAKPLGQLARDGNFQLVLSPLDTSGHSNEALNRGQYYIWHGFRCRHLEQVTSGLAGAEWREAMHGVGFRLAADEPVWQSLAAIADAVQQLRLDALVTMQLAADDPAVVEDDDVRLASRIAEAAFAARCFPQLNIVLDTFADNDRGYFVRNGLVDRRYNLRLPGRVLRHFAAAVADCDQTWQPGELQTGKSGCIVSATSGDARWALVGGAPDERQFASLSGGQAYDLANGDRQTVDSQRSLGGDGPWLVHFVDG